MSSISHLIADIPNLWAIGQKISNVSCGDAPLAFFLLILERAHIVQAVGQFDDDNPDVLRHGDEHFTIIFVLVFLPRLIADSLQFRQSVDKLGA